MIAISISILSLIVSTCFAVNAMQASRRSNELSENQKTAALISIISPACEEPEHWKMLIEYLAKNNKLPNFSEEDEFFLANVLNRLQVKAMVEKGKLVTKD